MKKKSFWQKLFGSPELEDELDITAYDEYEEYEEEYENYDDENTGESETYQEEIEPAQLAEELKIDLYQDNDDNLILEAFIPGADLASIDIEVARDFVSIKGERVASQDASEYYSQELNWSAFERNVVLPEEVDVDAVHAKEKMGVLKIIMPKFNKSKKRKVKVKSSK